MWRPVGRNLQSTSAQIDEWGTQETFINYVYHALKFHTWKIYTAAVWHLVSLCSFFVFCPKAAGWKVEKFRWPRDFPLINAQVAGGYLIMHWALLQTLFFKLPACISSNRWLYLKKLCLIRGQILKKQKAWRLLI